jgi:DNA-binding NarL/FixJ family response regulator
MSLGTRKVIVGVPPGILRSALMTYLHSLPGVEVQAVAEDVSGVARLLPPGAEAVVILDAGAADDFLQVLTQLRRTSPQANLIVLVNRPQQLHDAEAAGASSALLKGFLDERLRGVILQDPPGVTVAPALTDPFATPNQKETRP